MRSFAAALLLVLSLFIAGVMNCGTVAQLTDSIVSEIESSQEYAREGNWISSEKSLSEAEALWQEHTAFLHTVVNHDMVGDADSLFAQAKENALQHDSARFLLNTTQLHVQLSHMKEDQQLSIRNIF